MEQSFDIATLIYKSVKHELSLEEQQELDLWISESEANKALYQKVVSSRYLMDQTEIYQQFDNSRSWKNLEAQLFEAKTVSMAPRRILRYAASIFLPIVISIGVLYYFMDQSKESDLSGIDQTFKPGTQTATLILADGGEVKLDDPNQTKVLKQGKAIVSNGQQFLEYTSTDEESTSEPLIYNELKTPPGGRYQLKMADGTLVMLNAGSTLKYPVAFTDSIRMVYLTGEAFFEVNHTGKSFIVANEVQNIRVLGTTFNVSAYPNEPELKTTLIEGSIQIETNQTKELLQPGQQAVLERANGTLDIAAVNTSLYTSWANGKFAFNNDNLDIVIKRLSRWYDFDYVFENEEAKHYHFTGRIDDDQPISSILEMLELTTDVSFELDKNTIIIR